MPLISVIISVYNGEKTIRETIESVLNQTFTDFELIVIDDGSQDATLEIVSSIPDPRLKVFSHPNAGQAASNNWGLSLSTGEYIAFLDADDLWTPDKLEVQLKALQDNPQAAVALSWTDHIDESGQFLRQGPHPSVKGDAYGKLLLADFVGSGSNPLIRRQALNEVGDFEVSLAPAADWDLWLRLAARYDFVVVPFPQIFYRQCQNSVTTNVLRMEEVSLKTIERALSQAPESLQHLRRHSIANRYKYLTSKALENTPSRQQGLTAARFFLKAAINEPSMLLKVQFMSVMLFKITTTVLLSPRQADVSITTLRRVFRRNFS
jgi:glycosyltransferase involved in cell wall biosynthesis